jgi:hypothetical protein
MCMCRLCLYTSCETKQGGVGIWQGQKPRELSHHFNCIKFFDALYLGWGTGEEGFSECSEMGHERRPTRPIIIVRKKDPSDYYRARKNDAQGQLIRLIAAAREK